MKQERTASQEKQTVQINRYTYILYVILVVYLLIRGDFEWAAVNMGIAMVFDPFDPKVKWEARPLYQRIWLITYLALTFAGFLYLILH